jgi:16S rRNA (guanine966-N2)-methyltransferase
VRIIAGKYKGKRIPVPGFFRSRPTTDQAREALFNTLASRMDFEPLRILDLFSGTGAISLEFASRGALDITAVDVHRKISTHFMKLLMEMDVKTIQVITRDAFLFLKKNRETFDLIFADPPFDMPGVDHLPDLILESESLHRKGTFILEHAKKYTFTTHPCFSFVKRYSAVHFSFFTRA